MADTDLSKMKVADLKRELKMRGLSITGNKTELAERLQAAQLDGSDSTLDDSALNHEDILDDDVLNDDELDDEKLLYPTNEEDALIKTPPRTYQPNSPTPAPLPPLPTQTTIQTTSLSVTSNDQSQKKVVLKRKLISTISTLEDTPSTKTISGLTKDTVNAKSISQQPSTNGGAKENISVVSVAGGCPTAEKQIKLTTLTAEERLKLRAEKFGISGAAAAAAAAPGVAGTTTTSSNANKANKNIPAAAPASVDVLKKRAERFGGSVSKVMAKIENLEKLQLRRQRFSGAKGEITIHPAVAISASTAGSTTTIVANSNTDKSSTKIDFAERARLRLERFKAK